MTAKSREQLDREAEEWSDEVDLRLLSSSQEHGYGRAIWRECVALREWAKPVTLPPWDGRKNSQLTPLNAKD